MDVSSPDVSSPLNQLYGNEKIGMDVPSRGMQNQLLERQVSSPFENLIDANSLSFIFYSLLYLLILLLRGL